MNPAPPNNRANPANSAAPKQVISPQLPKSTSMPAVGAPQQAPTASPTSNPTVASQNMVHFPARTSAPPQAPLRPFIQSSAPTSLGTPKVTQAPPAASKAQPTNTTDLNEIRKIRSEEHTSELQSHLNLVCRLLLEKKKYMLRDHRRRDDVCGHVVLTSAEHGPAPLSPRVVVRSATLAGSPVGIRTLPIRSRDDYRV